VLLRLSVIASDASRLDVMDRRRTLWRGGHDVDVVAVFPVKALVDVVVTAATALLLLVLVGVACRGLKLLAAVVSNVFRVPRDDVRLEVEAVSPPCQGS
jgi:hypothetical protein